ncbi:DUF3298 domain-containing protein [Petralouisia muris]|uniref:DUF3298 domain-containing protein n=1 Tax=Petralouisia muris TaxID=3032872 RepID=A0AC61RZG1_9FIRM|nr:RsiV family protein [Petralouisia muris]TGY97493.1 DUF3298 domain-containing protein [Petralouisia muris]
MNHKLNQLKQDYQNIPIPEALKQQTKLSIEKAKADLAESAKTTKPSRQRLFQAAKSDAAEPALLKQDTKKSSVFSFWIVRGAAGAAAAITVLTILVNSNASIAYAMERIPVLGAIVKVITFREYEHRENDMEANIKIPKLQIEDREGNLLEDSTNKLNDKIEAYTNEIIAAYEADLKAAGGEGIQAVDLDYETVTDNDKLFSLRFHQTVTMAGAVQMEKIYHIDKQTGELITLKDLFQEGADYQTPITENIKEQMKNQMAQDETITYWLDSDVPEWNFTELSDSVNFFISESGKLNIVFDEYKVAPGFMGVVTFEIPTETVKDIIKDGYLL